MSKISSPLIIGAGGGGGFPDASGLFLSNHGNLDGLSDDDHTQYLLRADFEGSGTQAGYGLFTEASGAKLSDHGQLDGLSDDDHSIYHNDTRGDIRYFPRTDFNDAFVGASEAGQPVKLNADGKIAQALVESGIGGGTTVISTPTALTSFVEASAKNTEEHIHGGLDALNTGAALSAGSPLVVGTKGVGKFFLVVNAGADTTGTITVTGRSVDRNTGVEVEGDTSTITLAGLSTDNSDTDAGGHDQHKFGDVYFTSKWYRGSVLLTTADVDLSDVDIYHCSFEQFNDHTDYTITTFDINTEHNAFDNGELYAHLYKVQKQQDGRFTVSGIADLSIPAGSGVANEQQRLRAGGLAVAMSGSSDGIFVDMWFDTQPFFYTTTKVWSSMLTNVAYNIDHGSLSGLTHDDHAQYLLVDGTRDNTGRQNFTALDVAVSGAGKVIAGSGVVLRSYDANGVLLDTDGGPELNVRTGSDSAYGNIRAGSIMANSQLRFNTLANFQSSDGVNIEVSGASNADAKINAASGAFNQVTISGINVGDFLGATAAADLSAVAENILPDASGTREIGSPTKVWGSGHLDAVVLYDSAGAGWALTVDTVGVLTTAAV